MRNSFLILNLNIYHAINVMFKLAALNLHNEVRNFGICASVVLKKL